MTGIGYAVRDSVAEITMDNGPVNALTTPMISELIGALRRAAQDDAARAVIVASFAWQAGAGGQLSIYNLEDGECQH